MRFAVNKGKRIVFVSTGTNVGGAEVVLRELIKSLAKEGDAIMLISIIPVGKIGEDIRNLGIPVISVFSENKHTQIWSLLKGVFHFRPNVFQGWMYHGSVLASILGVLFLKPVYWSIHHASFNREVNSSRTLKLVGFMSKISQCPVVNKIIFAAPQSMEVHVRKGFCKRKCLTIANGVDVDVFYPTAERRLRKRKQLSISDKTKIIGIFASWQPIKDHRTFLNGAKHVVDVFSDVKFLLCGREMDSSNPGLLRLISERGLQEKCILMGLQKDITDLMNACDLIALTSIGESMPMVLIEGIACGVPCVSSDVGDCALVIGRKERLFVAGDDHGFFESVMMILSKDIGKLEEETTEDLKRIREDFSIKKMASQFLQLYS